MFGEGVDGLGGILDAGLHGLDVRGGDLGGTGVGFAVEGSQDELEGAVRLFLAFGLAVIDFPGQVSDGASGFQARCLGWIPRRSRSRPVVENRKGDFDLTVVGVEE